MENHERARIDALAERDGELRRLWSEHQDLESRLETLDQIPHLTPPERDERKRVQKRKLAGKDRIAQILARYAAPASPR